MDDEVEAPLDALEADDTEAEDEVGLGDAARSKDAACSYYNSSA